MKGGKAAALRLWSSLPRPEGRGRVCDVHKREIVTSVHYGCPNFVRDTQTWFTASIPLFAHAGCPKKRRLTDS